MSVCTVSLHQLFVATGLDYDVLLLHVDSVDTNNFGTYLYRRLAELSRPPYEVFHFNERDYGQGMN